MNEVFQKESQYRKLAYTESFKKMVAKHPKLLSIFQDLENKIKYEIEAGKASVGSFLEGEGIKVTVLDKIQSVNKKPIGSYFKAEIDGEVFFVKTVPGFYYELGKGQGARELASLKKAEELLKGLDAVEVVDFQLGYQDSRGTSYFVSKWEEGVILDDYLEKLESEKDKTHDPSLKQGFAMEQKELTERFKKFVYF